MRKKRVENQLNDNNVHFFVLKRFFSHESNGGAII